MRDKDAEPLRAKEAPGEPVVGTDGAELEVEEIRDARKTQERKKYLLKWKGFDRPIWAAARDLTHCKELFSEFRQWQRLRQDNPGGRRCA